MKKQNFFLLRKNLKENHTLSFLIYGGGGGGYNDNDDECNDYFKCGVQYNYNRYFARDRNKRKSCIFGTIMFYNQI